MSVRGDILSELAGALAELYSDQASVRAMGLIAGLTLGQISFDSRASNTWVFLLTEAEAQRRTQAVFDRAKAQHPCMRVWIQPVGPMLAGLLPAGGSA